MINMGKPFQLLFTQPTDEPHDEVIEEPNADRLDAWNGGVKPNRLFPNASCDWKLLPKGLDYVVKDPKLPKVGFCLNAEPTLWI